VKHICLFVCIIFLCALAGASDEQKIAVTITSSSVQGSTVVIEASLSGKTTEFVCQTSSDSCVNPETGGYIMVPAGADDAIYMDCSNIALFKGLSGDRAATAKVGVYCWLGGPSCFPCGSSEQVKIDSAKISDHVGLRVDSAPKKRSSTDIPLPDIFVSALAEINAKTNLPVLLPTELPGPFADAKHATVMKAAPDEYAVSLAYDLDIGDAGFAAFFSGKNNPTYSPRELPKIDKVKLSRGVVGFFWPVRCGGSCAPANLWWEQAGTLYQVQLKLPSTLSEKKQQGIITAVANSAIQAGPR